MTATLIKEDEFAQAIQPVREAVRRNAALLAQGFHVPTARLPASVLLKEALRHLEHEAARCNYEPLSRIAAVLHDVLRYNAIEEFNSAMLQGFLEAVQQATDGRADCADPFACELALYKSGLDWLPPVPYWEEDEMAEVNTDEEE